MCIGRSIEIATEPAPDRRIHERLRATDVEWLRGARIKYGAEVRVLDISVGGIRLETEMRLKPNAQVVLQLTGPGSPILMPSQIVRCRAASLGDIVEYEAACAFKRPLNVSELTLEPRHQPQQPASLVARPATASAGWQKVVARFNDGRIECGYTSDFHPSKTHLHLWPSPRHGESTLIWLSQLKALFFVREFTGDPTRAEAKVFSNLTQGRKVEVTFRDNEIIVGSTLSYRDDGTGFFLQPADPRSNNLRVFVTAAGMQRVRFLWTED
jgi:hypothetical protein